MWLAVPAGLALFAFIAVWGGFVPPPGAQVELKIRRGAVRVGKGRITIQLRDQLGEIVADEKLVGGWIAWHPNQRIRFSRGISPAVRQRIRNVVVNRFLE